MAIKNKEPFKVGDRNIQLLVRHGSLWFLPDRTMYIYYTPTHWHR